MMPEMDGYETTQAIRQVPAFQKLADHRAHRQSDEGDRDKCLEAGASDYVTKPVISCSFCGHARLDFAPLRASA